MNEHRRPVARRALEHCRDRGVVEPVAVHRGEQADAAQTKLGEGALELFVRSRRRGIEHEEADEAVGMQADRFGNGGFVPRNARDQCRSRYRVPVELGDPGRRQGSRITRIAPPKPGCDHHRAPLCGQIRDRLGEQLEKAGREEVTVRVGNHQPANLYPIPWTVSMNCGWRGFGSIFWRSQATWTSTVRVDGIEL